MARYTPPLRDMQFVLHEVLHLGDTLATLPAYAEHDPALIDAVLAQAGTFCAEVLLPLNQVGDAVGCQRLPDGSVQTPPGFKAAWQAYRDAGWPTLTSDPQWGGQGLPMTVGLAVQEMCNAANQAWTMYPGLTHGAYACLKAHGTPAQQDLYLPKLVSGEWMGTMCLTEPHCGTDLGLLHTRAEPLPDGSFALTGTKIFISSGEHDLADNIVHLVLARLPDAPAGTHGISLFVVPKFLPIASSQVGARNGVACGRLEDKMGIHGNATCEINLQQAQGWLVGEAHRGLAAMFVMMNAARLAVGVQSLGLTDIAYQNARDYARERLQMRALTGPKKPQQAADPILVHPDVRRMLLTQKAYAEGGRCLVLWLGVQADVAEQHPDRARRDAALGLVSLLTPVVKAFLTDNAFECTNLAVQVLGGHGYIREWGLEQHVRDARINMIYEGTNGIQALDLLGRKVLADQGARLKAWGALIAQLIEEEGTAEDMAEFINPLADLADKVQKLTLELAFKTQADRDELGAAAVDYLRVIGHLALAYVWARMAQVAVQRVRREGDQVDAFYQAKLATARFYMTKLLPETASALRRVRAGARPVMDFADDWF